MKDKQRHYLIVGPSWIGDMVMAQSLFIALKQLDTDCLIDVIAPGWSLPVLERMPEVNEGISADVSHGEFSFLKRRRLGLELRSRKYTHAIVIPRSWKSALIPYFANVSVRTGYRGEMRYGLINDIRVLDKKVLKQTVQRYVAHAYKNNAVEAPEIYFPRLQCDKGNQAHLIDKFGLKLDKPVVCMMPGAEYGPAKQWPLEYYARLAELLLDNGCYVWILGSSKDEKAAEIIAGSNEIDNLCGRTQLIDTVDLLSCARSVVSNDSGLMHVAAAVGADVHVIYGSSTPDYTPPLTGQDKSNVFYLGLDCSPCFERTCKFGHYDCLKGIKPEAVLESVLGHDRVKID